MRTFRPRPELPKDYAAVIDEFGALDQELHGDGKLARYNELRNAILSWFENFPAEKSCALSGTEFAVSATARRKERQIRSMTRLCRTVGEKVFLAHCSFALADADRLLSPSASAALIAESQTGPRSLLVAPRGH